MVNEQKALTTSYYNTVVSKYLFMAVVVVTESFATFTDIKLLQHVEYHTKQCGNHADSLDHKKDMFASYFTIWFFMLVDILLKILISLGFPVLFDGITTLLVITLRAQTNLKYGLMLKSILHSDPGHNSPPTTAQSIPHVPANSPETAFFMVSIEHNKSV
ncbi:hypothetical protein HDV02_005415 [Globomyces sp. JEL0801]|nr:hypothetical protein HDV02_005415 [Globomyces sp. JEL0801]